VTEPAADHGQAQAVIHAFAGAGTLSIGVDLPADGVVDPAADNDADD
jgi:hypothetical protein